MQALKKCFYIIFVIALVAGFATQASADLTTGNSYWLKLVNESGSNASGKIQQYGYRDAETSYTIATLQVWSLDKKTLLDTQTGLCIDTAQSLSYGNGWAAELRQGYHSGAGQTGTVVNSAAWDKLTYAAFKASDWSTLSDVNKSALQLAVWELASGDTAADFSGHASSTNGFVADHVRHGLFDATKTYVNSGSALPSSWSGSNSLFWHSDCKQDLLVSSSSPSLNVVPEPTSVIPLATGLVGFIGFAVRRFKKY